MMTLFSILMPLISTTAPFALTYCRFGASFMRALVEPVEPVELVEIAIHYPYHFLSYAVLHFSIRTATIKTPNWQLVCRSLLRESTTKKRRTRRKIRKILRVLRFFVVDSYSF